MKIKVSKKDLTYFIGFSFILFLFCSISVFNVLSLARGESEGISLNPFRIFFEGGDYIFVTIFVFIGIIIAIFASVSSSIFDHSSGIGFSIGEKQEKGYSRWLKENEMKKANKVFKVGVLDEKAEHAGVVFVNDGKNMWVDDSENHTLVIGVTGSGKTSAVVDPLIYSLCKNGESMVITDPKGEIFKDHAELLKARGYRCIVLNFRNPQLGNAWNPLSLPYQLYKAGNVDKAVELLDDVASNILKGDSSQDPFWENSAADYFSGLALGLFQDAKEEEVNLNAINYMSTVGEEKFGAASTYIKEYFTLKGEQSNAYVFASNTINSPTETKGSILSVFRQKIRLFASREQLSEMLAYSDFNMKDIGKESTAVFITIHDEKTTYHGLATIFIKQCYETLIDVAQENGGKLPHRTNFILDEFANMPALKDVTTMVTAARSRQIRFTFIIQNFAQLNEVYGEHDAETIRSNCQNLIYLLTTELAALEEISKLCGEVKSKDDEKTASTPLVTVSDLQKLQMNEVIILRNRYNPFRTKLKQAYMIDWGDKEYRGKGKFTEREKREIQLFDVREFVKVRKRSKMDESIKNSGSMGGAGGFGNTSGFGGAGGFAGITAPQPTGGFAGGAGAGTATTKIPTFEEFMAARNAKQKAQEQNQFNPLNTPANPNKPKPGSFDLDDLVKKIDAKIEELEAQEKANANKAASDITPSKPSITLPSSITKTPSKPVNVVAADNDIVKISDNGKESMPSLEDDITNAEKSNVVDLYDTPVVNTPKVEENKTKSEDIQKFSDLLSKASSANVVEREDKPTLEPVLNKIELPESKPSVMISNPIDSISNPGFDLSNTMDLGTKPLGGISDPTKQVLSKPEPMKFVPDISGDAASSTPVEKVSKDSSVLASNVPNKLGNPLDNDLKGQLNKPKMPVPDANVTGVLNNPIASQMKNRISDDQYFDDFFDN